MELEIRDEIQKNALLQMTFPFRIKEFLGRHIDRNSWFYAYLLFWAVYFSLLWARIFSFDKHNNLLARNVGVWGDWAVHLTMGSAMAFRDLILETSPLLMNAPFRYSFFSNQVSAMLIRCGVPFFTAFTGPSFIYSILFVSSIFIFYRLLFQSEKVAFIGSSVFLFNGGWGFISFFKDVLASETPLKTFFTPQRTYTNMEPLFIKWTSVIDTMLIPQRAFQLGFPLALFVLIFFYRKLFLGQEEAKTGLRKFLFVEKENLKAAVVGAAFGFLPIVHIHSFVAVGGILIGWLVADIIQNHRSFLKTRLVFWGVFALFFSVVLIPVLRAYPLFSGGHVQGVKWFPGWYAKEWGINIFKMWWLNWGFTPILGLLGFVWWLKNKPSVTEKCALALAFSPFFLLFVVSNLFLFHPWIWDNTKFLIWSSVGISGFAGYFLAGLGGFQEPPSHPC